MRDGGADHVIMAILSTYLKNSQQSNRKRIKVGRGSLLAKIEGTAKKLHPKKCKNQNE